MKRNFIYSKKSVRTLLLKLEPYFLSHALRGEPFQIQDFLGGIQNRRHFVPTAFLLPIPISNFGGIHCTKFEPFLKAIPTRKSETMRTKFCGNNFLGKGFRKTSADSFFLNLDVASGGGGVWGGILRLLLFFLLAKFGRAYTFSFFFTIIMATVVAIILPLIFNYLKWDPAIASGPFSTVIRDILSILIYFAVISALISFF